MVYRPPKKSPSTSAFPPSRSPADPLEGPLTARPVVEQLRAGDDRNLVAVNEDYVGGDLEDRLWLFWQRRGTHLIAALAVVILGVAVWQGYKVYQNHLLAELQDAYSQLDGPAAWSAFAKEHPDANLGKIAQLQAADALYKAGKYKDAADAYAQAVNLWGEEPNGQRAQFGRAVSLLKTDADAGKNALEEIYSNTKNNDNYRAQSAYFLAVLAVKATDGNTASKWIDRAKGFASAEPWPSSAAELADLAPILGDIKITAGAATSSTSFSLDTGASAAQPEAATKIDTMTRSPATPPANTTAPSAPAASAPAPAPAAPPASSPPASPNKGLALPELTPLQK